MAGNVLGSAIPPRSGYDSRPPYRTRRSHIPGPWTGGYCIIPMITATGMTASAVRAGSFRILQNFVPVAFTWFTRQNTVSVATLALDARDSPVSAGSAINMLGVSPIDLVTSPTGTIYWRDTDSTNYLQNWGAGSSTYPQSWPYVSSVDTGGADCFIRAGLSTFTGTSIDLSCYLVVFIVGHRSTDTTLD